MIVDSSAIVAIVFREDGYQELEEKLARVDPVGVGAPTLVETAIVISARLKKDARGLLARFVQESALEVIAFEHVHFGQAVDAWLRYGKGRHRAALNFGDCLSYAMAKVASRPLLCTGDDFSRTDLEIA